MQESRWRLVRGDMVDDSETRIVVLVVVDEGIV